MPPRRLRLDQELVRRGLARSREHASELVAAGRVTVSGAPATKPATGVTTDVAIVVRDDPSSVDYVSRGGWWINRSYGAAVCDECYDENMIYHAQFRNVFCVLCQTGDHIAIIK